MYRRHGQKNHFQRVHPMASQLTPAEDPVTAVRQYIEDFNKGDAKAMARRFTTPGPILDGLAPHVWQGPTACEAWYRAVVVPASMTFKLRGKQVTQSGAIFTTALRKVGDSWRIHAWAWAKGTAVVQQTT